MARNPVVYVTDNLNWNDLPKNAELTGVRESLKDWLRYLIDDVDSDEEVPVVGYFVGTDSMEFLDRRKGIEFAKIATRDKPLQLEARDTVYVMGMPRDLDPDHASFWIVTFAEVK